MLSYKRRRPWHWIYYESKHDFMWKMDVEVGLLRKDYDLIFLDLNITPVIVNGSYTIQVAYYMTSDMWSSIISLKEYFIWSIMFTVENGSSIQFQMTMIIVNVCSICQRNAKDVPHHPLSVCRRVWGYFINLFAVQWVWPQTVMELL